jgi:hypothetical protein
VFVLASIRKVRFPSLLFVTREIEKLPFASAVACSATKKSFHGGVWQKSGASMRWLQKRSNVQELLRRRNIRGPRATIVGCPDSKPRA